MQPIELKARRLALGLSQPQAAEAIGVRQATVSRWEKGSQAISPEAETAINNAFNDLEETLEGFLDLATEMLEATTDRPVLLKVWPDNESFWAANPQHDGLPAVIYQIAMARARMFADDPNMTHLVEG